MLRLENQGWRLVIVPALDLVLNIIKVIFIEKEKGILQPNMNSKYKNRIIHGPAVNPLALTSNTLVLLLSVRSDNPLLVSQWRNANASKN